MSLGAGVLAASAAVLLLTPSVSWQEAIVACVGSPNARVMERGRVTTAYDCGLTEWVRVAHVGGGWEWDAAGGMGGTVTSLGLRACHRVRTESVPAFTTIWYGIDEGPASGSFVRVRLRAEGSIEIQVMSREWVRVDPYGMGAVR